jgi:hypothetical protein
MFSFVGLIRAQRDGSGVSRTVQNDIPGGRSILGLHPRLPKTGFDFVQDSGLRALGRFRGSERLEIAGIARRP